MDAFQLALDFYILFEVVELSSYVVATVGLPSGVRYRLGQLSIIIIMVKIIALQLPRH